jgi:putative ABC transport system permease protein
LHDATSHAANDATLIVYRENRFCPSTSRLPEHYGARIAALDGVKAVVPMQVVVSNCSASLDVVTFRGVPQERFVEHLAPRLRFVDGSLQQWMARSDAAILGQVLAARRGLKVGQRFESAGYTVTVAGIVTSDSPQDQNAAYVHLPFLQRGTAAPDDGNNPAGRAGTSGDQQGLVTQFAVTVRNPAQLETVAQRIDELFAKDQAPTDTRPEKAFVAFAAGEVVEIIGFTRWLALGCVIAVLALVTNAIVLSVQDRIREHAVFQTVGFSGGLIGRLIVSEGLVLSLAGALIGSTAAVLVLAWGQFSLLSEGLAINFRADASVWAMGLLSSIALGVLAGLVPAWQASRRKIADALRA